MSGTTEKPHPAGAVRLAPRPTAAPALDGPVAPTPGGPSVSGATEKPRPVRAVLLAPRSTATPVPDGPVAHAREALR
ncbi:hypothetical protein [Streptomyces sp. NPDC002156]